MPPTAVGVDFRAACFCHRRVVDVGFVCSICLSSESDLSRAGFFFDMRKSRVAWGADDVRSILLTARRG